MAETQRNALTPRPLGRAAVLLFLLHFAPPPHVLRVTSSYSCVCEALTGPLSRVG